MLGKNTASEQFVAADGSLLINDIFYTVQGDGPDAGRPAIALRLSKCNLQCFFCNAGDFEYGQRYSTAHMLGELLKMLKRNGCNLVILTGGEPLLQNVVPLVDALNSYGVSVTIETNGTMYVDCLDGYFSPARDINDNLIVCSPKTAKINPNLGPLVGAWKYLVSVKGFRNDFDGLPRSSTQKLNELCYLFRPPQDGLPIYIQAMDDGDAETNQRNLTLAAALCLENGYRLSVPINKLAGLA